MITEAIPANQQSRTVLQSPYVNCRKIDSEDYLENGKSVDEIFVNNAEWRQKMVEEDPDFFVRHADRQTPRYLWIGCADSRTPAEVLSGLQYGSLFVHRNIANLVIGIDISCMSVVQYAVAVLKVQHIVVCGHYNCEGIAASMMNIDHGSPLENWLRNIRDVQRLHQVELDAIEDPVLKYRRLVEINVVEQALNIYKTRVVQKRRVETRKNIDEFGFVQPRVHPVVYDTTSGELKPLDSDIKKLIKELAPIYSIYESEETEVDEAFMGMGPSMVTPDNLHIPMR